MGVRLDCHPLIDLDRTGLADPAEIIALQVDQHDMLRALLRMGRELRHLGHVATRTQTPRTCSSNGTGIDPSSSDPRQAFRRGAQDSHPAPLRKCGKRGRIHGAQPIVERCDLRIACQLNTPQARQIGLVDVAGADMFLRLCHALEVGRGRLFLDGFDPDAVRRGLRLMRCQARIRFDPLQSLCGAGFRNGQNAIGASIVDQRARCAQCKRPPGQVRPRQRKPRLDLLNHLVTEEDGPAAHERQPGRGRRHSFGEPPVLQRIEKGGAIGHKSIAADLALGVEPQRGARLGHEDAGPTQGSFRRTVEQNGVALRETGSQSSQYEAGDAQLANDGTAHLGGRLTEDQTAS